jgi:hypothetical protein
MSIKANVVKRLIIAMMAGVLAGCQSGPPDDAMQLKPQSLQNRQLQSKKYDTLDEANMLSASMEVLQDMGFIIKESESKLGVIVGSKTRETDNKAQRYGLIALNILAGSGSLSGIEKMHKIKVSLVTIPDKAKKNTTVRVNFQRQVIDMEGNLVKLETIHEPELYQGFFAKLSKSVFLEAHEI